MALLGRRPLLWDPDPWRGVRRLCAPHESRLSPPGSGVGVADGLDLGAGVRHNPSVPAPSLPGRPPAVTPLAGGRLARWPLHRPDLRPDLHRTLARTGPGAAAARKLRARGRRDRGSDDTGRRVGPG